MLWHFLFLLEQRLYIFFYPKDFQTRCGWMKLQTLRSVQATMPKFSLGAVQAWLGCLVCYYSQNNPPTGTHAGTKQNNNRPPFLVFGLIRRSPYQGGLIFPPVPPKRLSTELFVHHPFDAVRGAAFFSTDALCQ